MTTPPPPPVPGPNSSGDERSTVLPPVVTSHGQGSGEGGEPGGPPSVLGPLRIAVAWFVLLGLAAAYLGLAHLRHPDEADATARPQNVSSVSEMTGRMMHGLVSILKEGGQQAAVPTWAVGDSKPDESTPWIDRVAFSILQADMASPEAGLNDLERVGLPETPSDSDRAVFDAARDGLVAMRDGTPPPTLTDDVRERLGWYAKALEQTLPPTSLGYVLILFGLWFAVVLVVGIILLVVGGLLVSLGKIRSNLRYVGRAPIYIETFVIWFFLLVAGQVGAGIVLEALDASRFMMAAAAGAMFASLLALLWPIFCGVRWSEVCHDIGLHTGAGPVREVLLGPVTYAIGLPLMAGGLLLYAVLSKIAGGGQPSHPVTDQYTSGPVALISIYVLACVAAPIVEEIAFRGVLYRHLRESGRWIGGFASAVLATLVSSVFFAAIHPQGFLFIPVLGGLATGFCLAREWRGSLIPCIVAHALNNAVTVTLGVAMASG